MARRGRPGFWHSFSGLVVLLAIGYVVAAVQDLTWLWWFAGFGVVAVWVAFVVPTYCDYRTIRGRGCRRGVRGKLRGCRTHRRDKRDAVFAAVRLRNPGQVVRKTWDGPPSTTAHPESGRAMPRRIEPPPSTPTYTREVIIFYCTVLGTAAGVVSAVVAVAG